MRQRVLWQMSGVPRKMGGDLLGKRGARCKQRFEGWLADVVDRHPRQRLQREGLFHAG